MKYSVKITSIYNGLYREFQNIIGDGFIDGQRSRFFLLEDGSRIEVGTDSSIIEFGADRARSIEQARAKTDSNKVIGKIGG